MTSCDGESRPGRRGRLAVLLTGALGFVFASGIVLAPALEARGVERAGALRLLYAPLCHQIPARSFTVAARPLAVCARCSGLYAGGVVGMLVAAAWWVARKARPRPFWLALAVLPTIVEFGLAWLGLPGLANLPRSLLAFPAGAMAGVFLSIGIHDLFESQNGAESGDSFGTRSLREG